MIWKITNFSSTKTSEFAQEPLIPPPLVRGDDLISMGLKPGPRIGQLLEAIQTAQLEGEVKTRAEAMELLKALLGQELVRKSVSVVSVSEGIRFGGPEEPGSVESWDEQLLLDRCEGYVSASLTTSQEFHRRLDNWAIPSDTALTPTTLDAFLACLFSC